MPLRCRSALLELAVCRDTQRKRAGLNENKVTKMGKPIRTLEAPLLRVAAGVTGALAGR